ncbi:DUF6880 family protein [Mesorhizobium sp. M1342]|uniref:DUF6880 family protein n=1 Tax=Mesorhizobium sp. M1342 TaxID=2957088 RepID=UPI0033377F23
MFCSASILSAGAGKLVIERRAELDGNCYNVLSPAVDTIADKDPLAATLLLWAMMAYLGRLGSGL